MDSRLGQQQQATMASQYDVRAPPRRRAKGEEADEQPVFLREAYNMISSCPAEIGGWSEEGDAIVIKNMKAFSEQVIPTAYRHNNFASFVRQLNFYGFRKVRSDSLDKAEWWIFRHPNFLRGQPHLIGEIKRSVHFAPENGSGNKEVSELKEKVTVLNDRLAMLSAQFDRLSVLVEDMNGSTTAPVSQNSHSKKRKIDASSSTATMSVPSVKTEKMPSSSMDAPMLSRQISLSAFDFDYFMALDGAGSPSLVPPALMSTQSLDFTNPKASSFSSSASSLKMNAMNMSAAFDESAEDSMSVCWDDDDLKQQQQEQQQEQQQHYTNSFNGAKSPSSASSVGSVSTVQDLSVILGSLAPDLKERFVDRLADVMGTQIANRLAEVTLQGTKSLTLPLSPASVTMDNRDMISLSSSAPSSSSSSSSALSSSMPVVATASASALSSSASTSASSTILSSSSSSSASVNNNNHQTINSNNLNNNNLINNHHNHNSSSSAFPSFLPLMAAASSQASATTSLLLQRQSSTTATNMPAAVLVNGEFVLPSGAKAPEIALPLASAAISAYLISALRGLSANLNANAQSTSSDSNFNTEPVSISV